MGTLPTPELMMQIERTIAAGVLREQWRVFFLEQFDGVAPPDQTLAALKILARLGWLHEEVIVRCPDGHDLFEGLPDEIPAMLVCRDCNEVADEAIVVPQFTTTRAYEQHLDELANLKKAGAAAPT